MSLVDPYVDNGCVTPLEAIAQAQAMRAADLQASLIRDVTAMMAGWSLLRLESVMAEWLIVDIPARRFESGRRHQRGG